MAEEDGYGKDDDGQTDDRTHYDAPQPKSWVLFFLKQELKTVCERSGRCPG
jgi:hypothetical protein